MNMKKIDLNRNWRYRRLDTADPFRRIDLPYDCMLHERRSENSEGGCNHAWFEGYDYEFVKEFERTEADADKHVFLECEGIYHRAEVHVNGEKVAYRPNGYLPLTADVTRLLHTGSNTLRIIARGADIPNARWYTGVGIYRPVYLYEAGERYVPLHGIRIRTVSHQPAVVEVDVHTVGTGELSIDLIDDGVPVAQKRCSSDGHVCVQLPVRDAKLWAPEHPALYTCRITFAGDVTEERFGIRTITCDAQNGFCINGRRTILRGACVHHDNGLLGSVTLPEAEERKVRLLQSVGFNAIRSAHNPASKALLDACDRYGMLVMEEYEDVWYVHKTKYDDASYVQHWYERDLADLAARDFNHPCVVMYSLGNEVSETAEEKGVQLFERMRDALKRHDDTRPVTCGINIGFNQAAATGHSFFSDEKAFKNDFKNLGTEDANHRKWMFGPLFTRLNAILPGCDRATKRIFAASDVAGYNYGILRYGHDRWKYPDRVIVGSETFCEDVQRFCRIARKNKGIIGDFVWTGLDHLGEVGLGAWEYKDYAPTYIHTVGWLTSGSGRIDITGKPLPEAYFMQAGYGLLKAPVIAVRPPHHNGERHSPSGWKFTNAVSSWAWEGCEGKRAKVEVYGCGAYVELYLNGRRIGCKTLGRRCRVRFTVPYARGTLLAIVHDRHHTETGRSSLQSAESETILRAEPEQTAVPCGKLCYVRLRLTDQAGTTKVMERKRIRVTVTGGELVGLGHACPYNEDGYVSDETSTYFGEAMAIVRAARVGRMLIQAAFDGGSTEAEVTVTETETEKAILCARYKR